MKKQKEKSIKFNLFCLLVCLSITCCVGEKDEFDDDPRIEEIKSDVILEAEYDIHYISPLPNRAVHFAEHFDDIDEAKARWLPSKAQKEENENLFKYDGEWDFNLPHQQILNGDRALVLTSKAKHAAISAKLDKIFEFKDKPLFVQYEVNFQNGMDCGGAYIKLLSHSKNLDLLNFHDKTPYTIMFGPDKCGNDIKLHFIFRHKNPLNGTFEEKHAKRPTNRMEENFSDKRPHLYRLKLYPDNNYEIEVDGISVSNGHLLKDMTPSVNPPLEIEDPNDVKPSDWDEREKIPDTTATKPDDWDETAPQKIADPNAIMPDDWLEDEAEMIPDENAKKPEDWDMDMDGTWEPPMISNPACVDKSGCGPWTPPQIDNPNYKGKWKAPLVNNPNYKGKWTRNMIPNPDYYEDKEPFKMTPIGAVGLEIWTMTDKVLFDNFIITDDEAILSQWTSQTFDLKKRSLDRDSEGVITRLINYSNAHPWLWAIYILVIGLPLVLIFTFCCGSNQDSKRSDAQRKKTDEPEVDEAGDAKAKEEPKAVSAKNSNTKVGMSKEQLEEVQDDSEDAEELEDDEEELSGDEDANEDKSEENSKSESKEEDDSTKETYTETDPDFDAPRKRKAPARKE